jgi:hypothetical protein
MTHSRRSRIAIFAIVAALVSGACAGGDIGEVLDIFGETDLSASDDQGVRASGDTVIEILSTREAEDNLERGLAENDVDAVIQAGALRPTDPRYPMHQAVLLEANSQPGSPQSWGAMITALGLVSAHNPEKDPNELKRLAHEMYLDALRDAAIASPVEAVRERLVEQYCAGINGRYTTSHTDEFPLEVAIYVATADRSLCN